MTSTFRLIAINLSAIAFASPLAADLNFTATGLTTGGTYGATVISADGSTIASREHISSSSTYGQAAIWTASGGIVGLGDFAGGGTNAGSAANGISTDGTVVVGYGTTDGRPIPSGGSTAFTREAFRWTAATGLVSLGVLPGSHLGTDARAVSADGSVIVGEGYNAAGFPEAFRWTAATGLQSLGFLPSCNRSTATGVSADGSVIVGYCVGTDFLNRAFRWTAAGGMVELGALPSGYIVSRANAISADGLVIVGQIATGDNSSANREAFRWTEAGGYVVLGDLPGMQVNSEAFAVSADGSVVVGSANGSTFADSSFIWDATNGLRSVRTILTQAALATGWSISSATGISGDGTKIVGFGSPSTDVATSWLLDLNAPPPPPASVALVWTESGPQPGPGLSGPSILRLGYDNGIIGPDIATQTGATGGFNGVEYANGLILVANQGSGGSRVHDSRYSPIIVSNVFGYDLDATPSFVWQATGNANLIIKSNTSPTISGIGVHDRSYSSSSNQLHLTRNTGFFTNALQTVDSQVYFSSSTTAPIGLHVLNPADGTTSPVFTAGSPSIYDFEIVGDQIYFGNIANNTIQRVKTDGTGLTTLVTGANFVNGIDVTDTHIYWSELNTGLIRRANLDGTNAVTLIEGRSGLRGVAVLPLSLTTGPAPQALSIGGLTNIAFRYTNAKDTPVPLTPASTSGLPVTLEIVSGPATLSGNSITYTGNGTVVVRATQAGDSSFAPATFTTSVNAAPRIGQTIDFPQPANVTYSGTPVVVTPAATASSGLAVSYFLISGPATYSSANKTVTVNGTGSITIRAVQTGDTTYAPATFVERTFTSSAPGADTLAEFLTSSGIPANLRGPNDDADNDGLDNLLEYALDLNPNGNAGGGFTGSLPSSTTTPTLLQLTYRRVRNDVIYTVETSPTLIGGTWTSVGVTQGTPAGDGTTTASIPVTPGSAFLRLVVTRNP
jgi:probable HAF family extracellular repeat protein